MAPARFLAIAFASLALAAAGPAAAGDAAAGKKLFKKHLCFGCHKLEPGKQAVGPSLAGIWGRQAGTVEGFKNYSKGLKESGIVWNEETLDKWLENPKAVIKKTKMLLAKPLKKAEDRANLIAYLKEVTSK